MIQFWLAYQVHRKLTSSASKGDLYETELLDQFADTDAARDFFARLDLQLNKVNQFYKGKEKEFLERGESLRKQMEILLDLKIAMRKQKDRGAMNSDSKDDQSSSGSISFGQSDSSPFLLKVFFNQFGQRIAEIA